MSSKLKRPLKFLGGPTAMLIFKGPSLKINPKLNITPDAIPGTKNLIFKISINYNSF